MGKISKVFYKEIDNNVCSIDEAAKFYYHSNLIGIHEMFHNDYEEYELSQLNLKNKIIGDAIKNCEVEGNINSNNTMMAISSLKDKVIIIAEIR